MQREFSLALYSTDQKLSSEALAARVAYAEDDGPWNSQTDIWLREAQTHAEQNLLLLLMAARKEHDKVHGTNSFSKNTGFLRAEFDPFGLEHKFVPPLAVPHTSFLDRSMRAALSEAVAEAQAALDTATAVEEAARQAAAKSAEDARVTHEASAESGVEVAAADESEEARLEARRERSRGFFWDSEKPKSVNPEKKAVEAATTYLHREKKLMNLAEYTPWDVVTARLKERRGLDVTPLECAQRYGTDRLTE